MMMDGSLELGSQEVGCSMLGAGAGFVVGVIPSQTVDGVASALAVCVVEVLVR